MKKKILAAVLAATVSLSALSGCGSEGNKTPAEGTGTAQGEQKSSEPVTLKVWRAANIIDPQKDPIMQEIQKKLNIKIDILTAPWDQETQKLNAMMAASEELDIIQAPNSTLGVQWVRGELMNDIGELIKGKESNYPYINSVINAESFAGLKVDGKSYYVAGTHHGQDWALYIRKDWLDKLGLKKPTTLEEYYDVLKAFKEKDPDGNGKADSIGIQASMPGATNFSDLDPLMHAFGGSFGGFFEDYVVKDGKVVAAEVTDNTKAGVKFINKLYREGILNTDFATLKNVDEANAKYLYNNKAGSLWTSRAPEFEENIKKADANATFEVLEPIAANGGQYLKSQGLAWWMLIGVPQSSKNPEKALELIEFVNSREGRELMVAGVKGKHYSELSSDGVYDRNKANWEKDFDVKANGYDYPLWWGFLTTTHGYIPCDKYPTYEEAMKNVEIFMDKQDAEKKFNWKTTIQYGAMYNEANPFHSVYIDEVTDSRNRIENDVKSVYFLKMLTAKSEADIDNIWNEYIKAWEAAGGKKVIEAYQKYYDENLKK